MTTDAADKTRRGFRLPRAGTLRVLIQAGFTLWTAVVGVRFGLFVQHYMAGQPGPAFRPPAVEAFLPVGALMSFRAWVDTGFFDPVHPAALVLLLTFVGMSLLARRSFCSFVCPVGTASEWAWKAGKRLLGRNLQPWSWLDAVLRSGKYLLLAFFLRLVFFAMPAQALPGFLRSPYWAVADVRMLLFFRDISWITLAGLGAVVLLSFPVRNVWCRYLCPYGALVGLAGFLSPWAVRRDEGLCTSCGRCTRACPSRLPVGKRRVVRSVECTGCLTCVEACPEEGALGMRLPLLRRELPGWVFPAVVLFLFALGVGMGMATGHWWSVLGDQEYRYLVPLAERIGI